MSLDSLVDSYRTFSILLLLRGADMFATNEASARIWGGGSASCLQGHGARADCFLAFLEMLLLHPRCRWSRSGVPYGRGRTPDATWDMTETQ